VRITGWNLAIAGPKFSKNDFSQHRKEKKKNQYILLWLVVWWIEWDKIFDSIDYVEKLDRFTKSTFTCDIQRNLKGHHQKSFGVRVDLITYFYLVFDAKSETKRTKQKILHILKKIRFLKKMASFWVFRIFRPEGSIWYGWKVVFRNQQLTLYQIILKRGEKKRLLDLCCRHLTY
jgi:hypothetical protein